MTSLEITNALIRWLRGVTGLVVIKDRQSGDRPALPYLMVDLALSRDLREQPADFAWDEDTATPIIEGEWVYQVFGYGPGAEDYLRRAQSAAQVGSVFLPMRGVVIHEVGPAINSIPDLVNNAWENRAQVNIAVRALAGLPVTADDIAPAGAFNFEQTGG